MVIVIQMSSTRLALAPRWLGRSLLVPFGRCGGDRAVLCCRAVSMGGWSGLAVIVSCHRGGGRAWGQDRGNVNPSQAWL